MSDPNGGGGPNRTVFRPSPLQGLNPGQGQGQGQSQGFGQAGAPPPGYPPPPPAAPAARRSDDDVPAGPTPEAPRNPMMEQAAPLLALLASVRAGRARISLPDLHGKVSSAIAAFEAFTQGRFDEDHRQRGKYALCSVADDVALNLPGMENDAAQWAQRSMTVRFFGENVGGDRFWRLLEEMIARPAEFAGLLELYHASMAAGFEGRYRVMPNGRHAHQEMMQRAFLALPHPKLATAGELSPHWRGEPTPMGKVGLWTPLILAAAGLLMLLTLIYIVLRLILAQTGGPTMTALTAINPDQPLRLSRTAPAPPPAPAGAQAMRLKTFLAPEIGQSLVGVVEDSSTVRVRTTVGQLFKPGSDQLEPERKALFERIGQAVEVEPGPVKIEGYTDSDRISTVTFPDNVALSQARADTVGAIIKSKLSNPGRVTTQGYGDAQPLAPNTTAAGKSQNRRVEVVIQRGG